MKSTFHYKKLLQSSLSFLFMLICVCSFSQVSLQWQKFYGNSSAQNDQARGMVADDVGNIYVTGISAGVNNKPDYLTIKYNSSGEQQWVDRYDGFGGNDEVQAIAIDKSGNIYVTGFSENGAGSYDFATLKYNNAGVQEWAMRFNGPANGLDYATAIKVDKNGNVYVSGFATVQGSSSDCAVIKYNSSGVLQWARYHDGSGHGSDVAFAMALDPVTSDVYVTGNTESENWNEDYIVIKYSTDGSEQWVRTYNGTANTIDDGRLITLDPKGNVYVSGISRAPGNVYDCTTIKYNPSGDMLWVTRYSGPANNICQPNSMIADKTGNIYITGFTLSSQYKYLCTTIKYNSDGIQQWVQLYSGIPGGQNIGWSITLDSQENIYVAGESSGSSTSIDYITLKYSPDGVQQWAERYDVSNLINSAVSIAVNKFNDVFVTGSVRTYADNTADDYDYATIKYIQTAPLVVTAKPDTTVYYGYGSNCVLLKATVAGGVAPFTFIWSPGTNTNNQFITVCPTTTSSYTVTVKDANGTTATATAAIQVIDVRCGNQGNKVVICHKGQELCIAAAAVAEHLQHGDLLGSCTKINNNGSDVKVNEYAADILRSNTERKEAGVFAFEIFPNPISSTSIANYWIPADAYVSIKLLDVTQREIATIEQGMKKAGKHTSAINSKHLTPGIYLCRIIINSSGSQLVRTQKIIVTK